MPYKYSTKLTEREAKAVGLNLPISTKHSIEICRELRGMALEKAKGFLEAVIAKKRAVPFRRFKRDVGHKPGMAAGRYPVKACQHILKIIKAAESNAVDIGLLTESVFIKSIVPQKASRPRKYGRHRGRRAKRTHIEVVLAERESEQATTAQKKQQAERKAEENKPPKQVTQAKKQTEKPAEPKALKGKPQEKASQEKPKTQAAAHKAQAQEKKERAKQKPQNRTQVKAK